MEPSVAGTGGASVAPTSSWPVREMTAQTSVEPTRHHDQPDDHGDSRRRDTLTISSFPRTLAQHGHRAYRAPMTSILVVEDDAAIRTAVRRGLDERGYAVATAATGMAGPRARARRAARRWCCSTSASPTSSGLTLISMIRAASDVPIIVITAQDDDPTMVKALDSGADDYVVKPFGTDQVAARIRAVLRRGGRGRAPAEPIRVGELVIDERARTATLAGRAARAGPQGVRPAARAGQPPGEVVTKRELLAEVWQQAYGGADRTVDVHLSWLRRKLGRDGGRAALPDQRARRRRPPGRPRRPRLMRRRISWLVVATTSTVVVSFVIPLCLLVRNLAEDRAMAAADQEARNVAIVVAGRHRRPARLADGVASLDARGAPATGVLTADGTVARRRRAELATTPRCSARPRRRGASRSSTATAAGC